MLLERRGHRSRRTTKLRRDEPLTERDIVTYLAHSRVTEQRASEQMDLLRKHFGDHPDLGRAVRMISRDEDNHLAYCHEELLRFAAAGHGRTIQRTLRECALAEIRVYRDVSLAVMAHMGRILGWPRPKAAAARGGHPRGVRLRARSSAGAAWSACGCPSGATPWAAPRPRAPEFA